MILDCDDCDGLVITTLPWLHSCYRWYQLREGLKRGIAWLAYAWEFRRHLGIDGRYGLVTEGDDGS